MLSNLTTLVIRISLSNNKKKTEWKSHAIATLISKDDEDSTHVILQCTYVVFLSCIVKQVTTLSINGYSIYINHHNMDYKVRSKSNGWKARSGVRKPDRE
jgi:hypothetical protein